MTKSLFISDLHLDPGRQAGIQLLDKFVNTKAVKADKLFILGDLFEYWLGDDACEYSGYQVVTKCLSMLRQHGTDVYFMHGNRDFLVGQGFANDISGQLLPDPTAYSFDTQNVLLMHGDSLCTDDVAHQKFRAHTRNPAWQRTILNQSIAAREELAQQLRMNSQLGNAEKPESIMDVNQQTVESVMLESEVTLLIHGHTHRTAIHEFELNTSTAHRIVLGDWYSEGNYLLQEGTSYKLFRFPGDALIASIDVTGN